MVCKSMNLLDLSPKAIDPQVFNTFPLDQMEALTFLPLYQEDTSLHVAVPLGADSNLKNQIQSLAPERALILHQASPDQIRDLLRAARDNKPGFSASPPAPAALPDDGEDSPLSAADHYWALLIGHVLALPENETIWLYEGRRECRLIRRQGPVNTTLLTIPAKIYHQLHERLEDETAMAGMWDDARWLLIDAPDGSQAAFKMWQMDCLEQHISWLQRIPAYSRKAMLKAHPQAAGMIEELRHLFGEHRRLIIGGKDASLIKQCFYSLIEPSLDESVFPPAFFVERDSSMYFPGVAQLTQYEYALMRMMDNFDGEHAPFMFFETEVTEFIPDDDVLSRFWSGRWENIAVYMPFENVDDMRDELQLHGEWRKGGFLPVFFHNRHLKAL